MSNKVSTKTLKTLYNEGVKQATSSVRIGSIDGTEIRMQVKKNLSMKEFGQFVLDMYNSEFNGNKYVPSSGAILFKVNLIEYYTDVTLPDDVALAYEMITTLGLDAKVIEVIAETQQYNDLITAVERAMEYRKETAFKEIKTVSEEAIESFTGMVDSGKDLIENITDILKAIDIEKINGIIQSISREQLEMLANLFTQGNSSAVM